MPFTFSPGQHVGGFVVEDNIPTGQFSETWRCRNPISGRMGVLKGLKAELLQDTSPALRQMDLIQRSREEVKILTALFDKKYTFVPNVYDVFEVSDGRVFFLSEFVQGRMLLHAIPDDTVAMESRAKVAYLLLSALESVHANGLVHRDVSPDNVMVRDDFSIALLDFGLARIKSEVLVRKYSAQTLTPISKIKYTPPYCLLEMQAGHKIQSNESWDLYAAGVVLFELFSKQIISGPIADIPDAEIAKLVCPETIRALVAHSQPNARSTAATAKDSLYTELRQGNLLQDIEVNSPAELMTQMKDENAQLREELQRERTPINFETVVQYLTRFGVVFEANPKDKFIKLESGSSCGPMTLVVDAQALDKNTLLFVMPGLRKCKASPRLFTFLDRANALLRHGRYYHAGPEEGVRYEHGVFLPDGYLAYDGFRRLVSLVYNTGVGFAKKFDGEFITAKKKTAENKASEATSGSAPSAPPEAPQG